MDPRAEEGVTPLMLACKFVNVTEPVVALLEAGADPVRVDFKVHATSLMYAAEHGHLDAVGVGFRNFTRQNGNFADTI